MEIAIINAINGILNNAITNEEKFSENIKIMEHFCQNTLDDNCFHPFVHNTLAYLK